MTLGPSKKGRGRPRVDPGDVSVSVHLRLPSRTYNAACTRAKVARVSVPELLRRELDPPRRKDFPGT
jgi:hypothetical protein